eukprot:TRINITY_DN3762_c0_g4_i1.p1 TRINITY_DN3762_c0_g4~~TRINITY_DN3762_c0_g4_i1.p1  ORF type:complete len:641 (-),score=136.07 TRINITY_DN3762_c0_g4_i1:1512-3434(-)
MESQISRRLHNLSIQQGAHGNDQVVDQEVSGALLALGAVGGAYAFKKLQLARDIPFIVRVGTLYRNTATFLKTNDNVPNLFESRADALPNKPMVVFDDQTWTYSEMDRYANRFAYWAISVGLRQGDVVALVMENRPQYICCWLGLAKVGVVTALINTNLRGKPASHSVAISKAKHVIIGSELVEAVGPVLQEALPTLQFWSYGGTFEKFQYLDYALQGMPDSRPSRELRSQVTPLDPLFYIYTSGTTGLPKAAIIKHSRFFLMGQTAVNLYRMGSEERLYCCLPLYHSAGGALGVGMVVGPGATLVLRRKFSASTFWEDCSKLECTAVQYIGELCRYLLATPPSKYDTDHKVQKAIGNGLRPEIWPKFQTRFNIKTICEFYGSTEGNAALFNAENRVGAVGFLPLIGMRVSPIQLVKFDVQSETPIRGSDGFCIPCAAGEVGELIGKIIPGDPLTRFDGYIGKGNTEKKILRDVFSKGDEYFRTGDLLKFDSEGFFYFVDRIGDTFRWKGENVSTNEVAEVLSVYPGVKEVNVYGVAIPNMDGRAGMASVVLDESSFDFKAFYKHVCDQLPAYARPIFLRISPEIEITGTFKHRKVELVKEGFDPISIKDKLYFADAKNATYIPLTPDIHQEICKGKAKL